MKITRIAAERLISESIRSDEGTVPARVEFKSLVENIKVQGIQTPLSVCDRGDEYFVIADGNRRFRAGCLLQIKEFECVVFPMERFEEIRISGNIHREELTPSLKAKYVEKILKHTKKSLKQVSAITGLPYDSIRKETYVARLIPQFQELIDQGVLSVRAGAYIAPLKVRGQKKLWQELSSVLADLRKKRKRLSRYVISSLVENLPEELFKTGKREHSKSGVQADARKRATHAFEVSLRDYEQDLELANNKKDQLHSTLIGGFRFLRKCFAILEIKEYVYKNHRPEWEKLGELSRLESMNINI